MAAVPTPPPPVETILYDIPFFRGMHGAGRYLLDGWQISTIMTAQSGFPRQSL